MQHIQPKTITVHHLRRRAVVYLRSAVCSQASRDRQVAQRDFALRWGWPVDTIETISDDGASSGLDASRTGYTRLLRMIEDGQVGLVLVADLPRLSRSASEVQRFLGLCQATDTLLAVNGTIVACDQHEQFQDQN